MKRILTTILALVLALSCCPSVFASAEGTDRDGSSVSDMDPHIKEIVKSQFESWLTSEEKELLANSDLSDEVIIVCPQINSFYIYQDKASSAKELISNAVNWYQEYNPDGYFNGFCLFSSPTCEVSVHNRRISTKNVATPKFIKDIINLPAEVEVNGKLSPVTGIYCFRYTEATSYYIHLVCILTESGALFKYYIGTGLCTATYSESDFLKYSKEYRKYVTTMAKNEYGRPISGGSRVTFSQFVDHYDQYMKQANERLSKIEAYQRTVKINRIYSTYGPIALGVVLVAGVAAVGVVIYRKRRKAALPVEAVADPVDDP